MKEQPCRHRYEIRVTLTHLGEWVSVKWLYNRETVDWKHVSRKEIHLYGISTTRDLASQSCILLAGRMTFPSWRCRLVQLVEELKNEDGPSSVPGRHFSSALPL